MPDNEPGLRERKKAKTRLSISQIATKMFIERGFEAVTVAEVAAAADCPDNVTPFNGDHTAGIQVLSTRTFGATTGPLRSLAP